MPKDPSTIFTYDVLVELDIDFEPPLPPSERFFELDEDEIIDMRHEPFQHYRCLKCRKNFYDLISFLNSCRKHFPKYKVQSNEKVQKDNILSLKKVNPSKKQIKSHNSSNSNQLYICDLCGIQFKLRSSMKTHFRIHLNKLQSCSFCGSMFTRHKTLQRHISVVHNNGSRELKSLGNEHRTVNCLVCDRLFESVNNLRIHEANHSHTTATCHICGFICKSKKILTKHERKHLNIKYPCKICGAQLNSADSLRGHLKTMHTTNKYKCGICGVEYRHRGNYNDHIAGHLDPESKICEICNFEWDSRRSCLEHKRKKHPGVKLDYSLPKLDPSNLEMVEMLRKLIDALPRHNGKPNHLEVSMKSVAMSVNVSGIESKNKRLIHTNAKGKRKKSLKQTQFEVTDENVEQQIKLTMEQHDQKHVKKDLKKSEVSTEAHILSDSYQLNSTTSAIYDNQTLTNMNSDEQHDLMDYNDVFEYSHSSDTFEAELTEHLEPNVLEVDESMQEMTTLSVAKSVEQVTSKKTTLKRKIKSGDELCRICNQYSPNIKVHLKFYHSDCVLDRICRICQKIAMCKRDLREHIKIVHKKQFPAYQLEIMQKKHPLVTNLPQELYCSYCPAKFLEQNHLTFHLEIMHSAENNLDVTSKSLGVDCKLCGKSFPSQNTKFLKKHINSNHGHSLADCICFICGVTFVVKNYLKIHLDRNHNGLDVNSYRQQCSDKINKFKLENPEYPCDSCNHYYVDLEDLNYHREVMHQARIPLPNASFNIMANSNQSPFVRLESAFDFGEIVQFNCEICKKIFSKKEVFDTHQEHHAFGLLYCQECDKHFTGLAQKREHDAYKHGIGRKAFVCDLCGEKLTRKKTLKAHFELHCPAFKERPQMKWKCSASKLKIKLEKKLRLSGNDGSVLNNAKKKEKQLPFSHGTEKKMCDLCGKICCNDYRLMEHGRRVHGVIFSQYEELYKQDLQRSVCECGKVFLQLGHYLEHKKVHAQQLETCKVCGIIVKGKKTLARHELIHKPKSFSCDICGMKFHQKRTMTVHKEEKHSLSRFVCKYCQQEFKYGANYREHIKGHEVPNFLRCEICNKDYASRGCLRTHRKRTHPEIYVDQGPKSKNQRHQSWNQYVMQAQNSTDIQIDAEQTVTLIDTTDIV